MSQTASSNEKQTAPRAHRKRIAEMIEKDGEAAAAKKLGLSRSALLRAAMGLPVRRGTLSLLREQFGASA